MDEITIVDVPDVRVLGMTKRGSYTLIPELLMKVYDFAQKKNAAIAGPPIVLCHETSPESVKEANEKGTAMIEIAWPVTGAVKGNRQVRAYDLSGGKMVHAIHRGPYAECEPAYGKLIAWIAERNLTIAGPVREVYVNDPREVEPAEILTEIYIPVQ